MGCRVGERRGGGEGGGPGLQRRGVGGELRMPTAGGWPRYKRGLGAEGTVC